MNKPTNFGIWANTDKPAFWKVLPDIISWAKNKSIDLFITTRIESQLKDHDFDYQLIESADDFVELDFILTLGGDGTIFSLARAVGDRGTPILGIHLGELGFLAEVVLEDMFTRLDEVVGGDYNIQKRMVIKCIVNNGTEPQTFYALNDIVVDRGKSHRLLNCELLANDNFVAKYKADGLIVATPTGSTAYSLASGGPIVIPTFGSMVVTPICPHTLTLRPIVFPDDQILEISFPEDGEKDMALAVDGQVNEYLESTAKVVIQKAPYKINMVNFTDSNYFNTLRTKLGWGVRGVK
ncbi:NAD kinase [hydrothermal vent metagenome]|uniref:NAD kinase n=1 Tax=hydrothermal vent metagenome TaxID=652676 RepID=A0A160VF55_9ZZZZ